MGLELTRLRARVAFSTNWASRAPRGETFLRREHRGRPDGGKWQLGLGPAEPRAHAKLLANTQGASSLVLGFAGLSQGSSQAWQGEHGSGCGPATLHGPVACASCCSLERPPACDRGVTAPSFHPHSSPRHAWFPPPCTLLPPLLTQWCSLNSYLWLLLARGRDFSVLASRWLNSNTSGVQGSPWDHGLVSYWA